MGTIHEYHGQWQCIIYTVLARLLHQNIAKFSAHKNNKKHDK